VYVRINARVFFFGRQLYSKTYWRYKCTCLHLRLVAYFRCPCSCMWCLNMFFWTANLFEESLNILVFCVEYISMYNLCISTTYIRTYFVCLYVCTLLYSFYSDSRWIMFSVDWIQSYLFFFSIFFIFYSNFRKAAGTLLYMKRLFSSGRSKGATLSLVVWWETERAIRRIRTSCCKLNLKINYI